MKMTSQFGETVPGYTIPVLNEREIRAAAGILFLATFLSLMFIIFTENFVPIKYVITLFFADFIVRVMISPRYSPTLIIGRLIVSRQNPEYVGAAQKKVAWIIGVILSAAMFILMVIMNTYSIITGIICLICLLFLLFESSFGICLGCIMYKWIYKDKAQYCPGEVCDIKARQPIQKTSAKQLLAVLGFILLTVGLAIFFNHFFQVKPHDLFEMLSGHKP
ncbi:MAG: DUF4395 domain-containing protein [Chitinophagaceae bacterium]|nr:DUF4395 domain-containing protein [Chitinophagaceae bacterium]